MYSNRRAIENYQDTTSTPKRRRLGTGRILRPKNYVDTIKGNDFPTNYSPINCNTPCSLDISPERSESPHLPCNQVEYLCDSNLSSSSDIPCSPDILGSSVFRDVENWESLVVSTNRIQKLCNHEESKMDTIEEFDEISEEMFNSKLEQSNCSRHANKTRDESNLEKSFRENINHSFDVINQSISRITDSKKCDKSSLFETKDSFLLDIKESGIVTEESRPADTYTKPKDIEKEGFYGLPMVTKGLFKNYRNIEKFYDWQEECLNLDAIRNRQNLIYALPTSGGKTLVAEVLMLREVLVRKRNALFILPFVAIVQEKIWALSPFAIQLDFLVEEYAAGKGHIPPKKRRKKSSIYIATIEKGLALIRSLIELNRLDEIGLIVVDELHLIGEKGRGGTLETLLTTVLFANKNIQIVGMSATIGNLAELAQFLRASVFTRHFRPVELTERVKLGDMLHHIRWGETVEIVPDTQLTCDYNESAKRLDPDGLAALVWTGTVPSSCLVFCPTKKNCENVASLLCKLQPRELANRNSAERLQLEVALRGEGAAQELWRSVKHGVAFHHAGLAPDERAAVEHAFRSGVVTVLCCTSTLAAGVNLPAARVLVRAPYVGRDFISLAAYRQMAGRAGRAGVTDTGMLVRAPYVGRDFISLAAYRQMAGRAGRAGVTDTGESIIICSPRDWPRLRAVFARGLAPARSVWAAGAGGGGGGGGKGGGAAALLLSGVALGLATTRAKLHDMMRCTLLAVPHDDEDSPAADVKAICDSSLQSLLKIGALEADAKRNVVVDEDSSRILEHGCTVYNDTELTVSKLAKAAIRGCMDLSTAKQLLQDLEVASRSLVLMGSLHLLYLVTPHDGAGIKPDYRHYYSLYCNLDDEGIQTAKILGITEMNAIRMVTGKPITNVPEKVLCRFYLALMLHDLWKQVPFPVVAEKYIVPRGTVQSVMTSASAFAASARQLCEELPGLWPFTALLAELAPRLQHCAAPHLQSLMELPNVKKTRALQLVRAGYKRIEDLAKASADNLVNSISHMSRSAAEHLISAARMMLIEKVENLRAEAEDVMEELNV